MALTQNSDIRFRDGDLIFDAYDEQVGRLRVIVSREALDDFAGHRGLHAEADEIWRIALPEILELADRKLSADPQGPREILIRTHDLNG